MYEWNKKKTRKSRSMNEMDLNVCKTSYLVFLMVESISIFIVTNNGKKLLGKQFGIDLRFSRTSLIIISWSTFQWLSLVKFMELFLKALEEVNWRIYFVGWLDEQDFLNEV